MSNNNKVNVRRVYLRHEGIIHEFKTYTSPFVCKVCYHDPNCPVVTDGFSDEPIEILNFNKFEKQFKYESTHFYGEGYGMDIISIEIKLINSYAFSILISRESPFTEMPLDFHEITSPSTITPKYIHVKILEKLKSTVENIDSVQKLLLCRKDDDESNHGFGTGHTTIF